MEKQIEELAKLCKVTKTSTDWADYEALEYAILQASYKLEDDGDKLDTARHDIDDKKEDRRSEMRVNYSSDTGCSKMVNKEFREAERPVIIGEEMNKRHEKRLKATVRRADCVKSRHIKSMADAKRESNFTS